MDPSDIDPGVNFRRYPFIFVAIHGLQR